MTKWHAPSRCKERLSRGIGIKRAANIQHELTKHAISVANSIKEEGLAEISLSISGLGPKASQRWGEKEGIQNVFMQGAGSLGLKMKRGINKVQARLHPLSRSSKDVIVIGTDLPTLCQRDLIEAIEVIKNDQIVLGPSKDGGYWLIGLNKKFVTPLISWPFSGIPWGTADVLRTTTERAKIAGVKVHLLRQQNDIDQIEDLKPWLR